jgi:hypothetical protein
MLPYSYRAPFGFPVVPEVYTAKAASCRPVFSNPAAGSVFRISCQAAPGKPKTAGLTEHGNRTIIFQVFFERKDIGRNEKGKR